MSVHIIVENLVKKRGQRENMKKKVELFYELMLVWFSDNLGENVWRRKEKKNGRKERRNEKKVGK